MTEVALNEQVAIATPAPETAADTPMDISDLLVEDVSIDGMCGVY
jgi:mycofactocin precursor